MIMEKEMHEREYELGGSNSVCYSWETNVFDFDCNVVGPGSLTQYNFSRHFA